MVRLDSAKVLLIELEQNFSRRVNLAEVYFFALATSDFDGDCFNHIVS